LSITYFIQISWKHSVMSLDARKELADAVDGYYWSAAENFQWRLDTLLAAETVCLKKRRCC